jgi:hypothetical protein
MRPCAMVAFQSSWLRQRLPQRAQFLFPATLIPFQPINCPLTAHQLPISFHHCLLNSQLSTIEQWPAGVNS